MPTLRVVSRERLADMETPVSAYLKLCRERPDSFLLESVETKDITGRYSIVACDPISGLQLEQDKLLWWDKDQSKELPASQFFDLIRSHAKNFVCEPFSQMPAVG